MKDIKTKTSLNSLIIDAIEDIKGHDIVSLDLRKLDESICDYFIVCHGDSTTQVSSIADSVYQKVKDEKGLLPTSIDGKQNANWIVLDYFDVVVHIFYKETRDYYQLEELWSDAIVTRHN